MWLKMQLFPKVTFPKCKHYKKWEICTIFAHQKLLCLWHIYYTYTLQAINMSSRNWRANMSHSIIHSRCLPHLNSISSGANLSIYSSVDSSTQSALSMSICWHIYIFFFVHLSFICPCILQFVHSVFYSYAKYAKSAERKCADEVVRE